VSAIIEHQDTRGRSKFTTKLFNKHTYVWIKHSF